MMRHTGSAVYTPTETSRCSRSGLAVAQGRTNAEIAAELFMSVASVKAHLTHVFGKPSLNNRTQIAMLAREAGLV